MRSWLAGMFLGFAACAGSGNDTCPYSHCGPYECPDTAPLALESGRYVYREPSAGPGVPESIDSTDGPLYLDVDTEAGTVVLSYTRRSGESVTVVYSLDQAGLLDLGC